MKLFKMMNPVTVTKGAFGVAGATVGLVDTVARGILRVVVSGLGGRDEPTEQSAEAGQTQPESEFSEGEVVPPGPTVVSVEPAAPTGPPIDVVGEALAAEAALGDRESPEGAGVAHEPRGASRDEEHGHAPLQPAEAEGIADEVTTALEGEGEPEQEHLSEPLIDPAEAKALAAEMETLTRAADPHKG